ncbi:MAG: hypothetical protein K0S74_988 [Chlamydiales bacterium]|jgi:hypothetical protein|nr:hypothetical protein [Chlamydiales bacterium]
MFSIGLGALTMLMQYRRVEGINEKNMSYILPAGTSHGVLVVATKTTDVITGLVVGTLEQSVGSVLFRVGTLAATSYIITTTFNAATNVAFRILDVTKGTFNTNKGGDNTKSSDQTKNKSPAKVYFINEKENLPIFYAENKDAIPFDIVELDQCRSGETIAISFDCKDVNGKIAQDPRTLRRSNSFS